MTAAERARGTEITDAPPSPVVTSRTGSSEANARERSRRDDVVAAAAAMFAERGYTGTSIRDLAKRLGIKAGSLYTHITTKEDLLYQLLDDVYAKYMVALAQAMAENGSPEAKLRAACRGHVRVIAENLDAARVALADARHLSPQRRNEIYAGLGAYDKMMGEIVTEGVHEGLFRPVDLTVFVQSLLGSLNYVSRWYSPSGVLSADDIADRIADVHLHGVLVKGP